MFEDLARQILFPGCPERFPGPAELARIAPGARIVSVRTSDGLDLACAHVPCGAPRAPVAVYLHGNGESAAQNLWLPPVLAREGVDTFLAEYRGYGGNDGSPSEEGLYRDAEAALAWLASEGFAPERVVLVGRSIGTGVAAEMAHRGKGRALVLVSPFTTIVDLARRMVGPLANALVSDRFDTIAKVPALEVPVVVIHGTDDELIPYSMGAALAKAARRGSLVPIEDGTHNELPGLPGLLAREIAALVSDRTARSS